MVAQTLLLADAVGERLAHAKLFCQAVGWCLCPESCSTRRWSQCMLDMGFMLSIRAWFAQHVGDVFIYGLADSIPQKGFDWLKSSL